MWLVLDEVLDCVGLATTCSFNRRGTLLAVGCNDGRIVIWDFLTRSIAKVISAHVHPVCTLSWNRTGHKLLSAATDGTASMWDVLTGNRDQTFRFPSIVMKIQFHPRNSEIFLATPMKHAAILMTFQRGHRIVPVDNEKEQTVCASFDRRGQYLFTGNSRGKVNIFDSNSLKLVASFRVSTSTNISIKSIEFPRKGSCFLVNSADKMIRVYECSDVLSQGRNGNPEPIKKLYDLVDKSLWKKCCFSGNSDYIVAGSANQHSIYIWETSSGNLVKFFQGNKGDMLLDIVWHPVRPIVASISNGAVSIWSQHSMEFWSAYEPGFNEMDENIEYEERESEFDAQDEDKDVEEVTGVEEVDEDVDVDVTTVDPVAAFVSSDEEYDEDEELQYLPMAAEIEVVEETRENEQNTHVAENSGNRKRKSDLDRELPSVKKKHKLEDNDLQENSSNLFHQFLSNKKPTSKKLNFQQRALAKISKTGKSHQSSKVREKNPYSRDYDYDDDDY